MKTAVTPKPAFVLKLALILTFLSWYPSMAQVKLKWLYFSGSTLLDRWNSGGLTWKKAEIYPETMAFINSGAQFSLRPKWYGSIGISTFYSRVAPFRNLEELVVKSGGASRTLGFEEYDRPAVQSFGLGDLKLGIMKTEWPFRHEVAAWIPTGYKSKERFFHSPDDRLPQAGFHLARPWTGFGVYRLGYSLSISGKGQYAALTPAMVVFKPSGERRGMVEPGDWALNGFYSFALPISKKIRLKPKLEVGYGHFHWEGKNKRPRQDFNLQPGLGFSYSPHWSREIAFSLAFTAYGFSRDKGDVIDSPRKITLGIYYGIYR
jgi:hypothetical protein